MCNIYIYIWLSCELKVIKLCTDLRIGWTYINGLMITEHIYILHSYTTILPYLIYLNYESNLNIKILKDIISHLIRIVEEKEKKRAAGEEYM